MATSPTVQLAERIDLRVKRLFDVSAASIGFVLISPLLLVIGLAVKLYDQGPIFYRARRIGLNGEVFGLYKFRTMIVNADRQGGMVTTKGDSRITPVGRWLRRTKLDELPQLLNVIRGDMSLVGPRPEDSRYVALYTPEQRRCLSVRPGITSAASLAYRHEEQILSGPNWEQVYIEEIMPAKLRIDLAYLDRRSFWTDIVLIVRTVLAMFR